MARLVPEGVIAEKFVALGRANSRMKDYYDVWVLMSTFDLDPDRLSLAIAATFAGRNTAIPKQVPDGISDVFAGDLAKQQQWSASMRSLIEPVPQLGRLVVDIRDRLMPFLASS